MVKIIILNMFFVFICTSLYGQIKQLPRYVDEFYSCLVATTKDEYLVAYFNDKKQMCVIELFHDEKIYAMTLSPNEPLMPVCLISLGTYVKSGNTIIFTDNGSRLKMKANIIAKGKLKFRTAYDFMLENMFDLYVGDRRSSVPYEIPASKYAAKLRSANSVDDAEIRVKPGQYTANRDWFSLSLNTDNTFSYYSAGYLLLQGIWMQKGDKLILHDTHFNYDFTMIVQGDKLKSAILPGDLRAEGSVFSRQ